MKKYITLILALALVMSLSVPAFAEGETVGPGDKVEVGFTFEVNEPKYTVEIPAVIELELGGVVNLPVTVSGGATETLTGRKIVLTLEDALNGDISYLPDGVHPHHDWLIVENNSTPSGYYKSLWYVIISNETVSDRLEPGKTLLEFTVDGEKDLVFYMPEGILGSVDGDAYDLDAGKVYPNSTYTGWVTFGIKLEW